MVMMKREEEGHAEELIPGRVSTIPMSKQLNET